MTCPDHRSISMPGCQPCRDYAAQRMRDMRDRNRATLTDRDGRDYSTDPRCRHGHISGYTNYNCRCADCVKANTDWQAVFRQG